MSNQWQPPLYQDGVHTSPVAVSLPVFSCPIPNTSRAYIFEQDFQCLLTSFAPIALNTAHPSASATPDYSKYVLVNEGQKRDIGGGMVRWTRTYALVPSPWDDWETYAYNFIGYVQPYYLTLIRNRIVKNVSCRVRRDYFLANGTAGDFAGVLQNGTSYSVTGGTVVSEGTIVTNFATQYASGPSGVANIGFPFDLLDAYTIPTVTTYASMITDATTNLWAATVYAQTIAAGGGLTDSNTGGQITAEDSRLSRWQGNIWVRETRYVLAQ